MRGLVVSLSPAETVTRALYLAGERTIVDLDEHVLIRTDTPERCPTIYYRLKGFNGGRDPRATDPATRWIEDGGKQVNVTADCVGGASWCGGWDRFQPERFEHIYEGWINTDSMMMDATKPRRCFEPSPVPRPGWMVVCGSGSRGHKVGHVGTIVSVPAEWDETKRECWDAIGVVDIAGRDGRANMRTTGRGWFGTDAMFLRSAMRP
jgi:hypothetical protein